MSSAVDEDTVRAINSGRETLGTLLSSVQTHLQKVFIVFVIGFIGSFYALRVWIWGFLVATAEAEMSQDIAASTDVITRTPFEVILLQAKIGMFVGVVVAIPALLYLSRDELRRRGLQSAVPISRGYVAGLVGASLVLFCAGVLYAYGVFFPFAFDFLATNAVSAGVKPSFGITEFTEFMALLTLSFGLAAQLPLFMGVLSYTEIVPYETFRDKWRHAVVGVTVFGALFSPPDPFTLIMWAMPMVALYVFSLGLAKVVANVRRRGAARSGSDGTGHIKRRGFQFGGALALAAAAATAFVSLDGLDYLRQELYPALPGTAQDVVGSVYGAVWPVLSGPVADLEALAVEHGLLGEVAIGLLVAGGVGLIALFGLTVRALQRPVYPREDDIRSAEDPDEVDFETLTADDVADVPVAVFREMDEETALEYSRQAMYDDDREKAQAILDRFDGIQESTGGEEGGSDGSTASEATAASEADEEGGGLLAGTAAGMLDPFTEEETTEDDIGGYAYDVAFVLNSLTSKMFRIVAVFMLVMGGTFFWLYQGGLGQVLITFLERVPPGVLEELVDGDEVDVTNLTMADVTSMDLVIALHPVEVLIFEVKVSVLAAIVAILPMVLYYAWPAAKERGLVYGDQRVFAVWGGALLGGFAVGTYLGFFWIAPSVISYLVTDAVRNEMVVSYRISSFFWLVIFTTVGIGFLFNIVVTMALFHVGGIVSYRAMLHHWRPVVVAVFVIAAIASPKGILTMLLLAIPIALTYVLGLIVLYALTGGGRLFGGGPGGTDPEPEPEAGAVGE